MEKEQWGTIGAVVLLVVVAGLAVTFSWWMTLVPPASYGVSASKEPAIYTPPVPGAIDVYTSTHIAQTICNKNWSTASIRPPTSYTHPISVKLVGEYNAKYGTNYTTAQGELDHVISIELAGSPTSTDNLAFEPGKIPNPKDKVENFLHKQVCSAPASKQAQELKLAQKEISTDWHKVLIDNKL